MTRLKKDDGLEKIYWSLGEVATMMDMTTTAVRYWIKLHPYLDAAKKNNAGLRYFTIREVMNLKHLKGLIDVEKYTHEGADVRMRQFLNH